MSEQRYIVGDAIEVMASLPSASVDTVVTSPPFLGLRNYESGDRRELGHETSPGSFIGALLNVVAACRRVLKPTGSLCLELGDTFADSGGAGGDYNPGGMREGQPRFRQDHGDRRTVGGDLRPGGHHRGGLGWPPGKSMCLVPHLFAASLAYQQNLLTGNPSPAGEWRIRNMVCWARRNPTPGAVGDKLRVGTSYITIACPNRQRYWDAEAIGVPKSEGPGHAAGRLLAARDPLVNRVPLGETELREWQASDTEWVPPLDWMVEPGEDTWAIANGSGKVSPIAASERAHYAVWPEEIARRLILATCPPGGVVLDPFAGTATTGAAAQGVGRSFIGIDIDARNVELAREKMGMFLQVES